MSENHNHGQQIKRAVERALETGDFDSLNALVKDTVNVVAGQVKTSVSGVAGQVKKSVNDATVQRMTAVNHTVEHVRKAEKTPIRQEVLYKKVDRVSAILLQLLGGIGVGIFGLSTLVLLLVTIFTQPRLLLFFDGLCTSLAGICGFLLAKGCQIKARLKRSQRYYDRSCRTGYCNVDELAQSVGRQEKQVVNELKTLIAKGAYPQGHLDQEQKCFLLTDEAYKEYQRITAERTKMHLEQERQAREAQRLQQEEQSLTKEERDLRLMVVQGQDFIEQIRQKNEQIPGEVFSQKLYRMETVLTQIFQNLEKRPQYVPQMNRLMQYYLPTALKLVSTYEEFTHVSVPGDNVMHAQQEIENTVDVINDAFEELLNQLFADVAMDVETDAQVLKTILIQEGLSREGQNVGGENGF